MIRSIAHAVSIGLWILAATCIVVLMVVSFTDVTLRTFGRPVTGAYEITEIGVGAMIFAALPIVTLRGQHVSVTLLSGLYERNVWLRRLVFVVSRGITAAVFLYLGYRLWGLGNDFRDTGAAAIFADFPLAPFAWFAAVMCWLGAPAAFLAPRPSAEQQEI